MSEINWLWVGGGVVATLLLVSAMSRRQSRLTETLRNHVKRTQDKQEQALTATQPAAPDPSAD